MKKPLHILIVEDAEEDADLVVRELQRGGYAPDHRRVETEEEFRAGLADGAWDVVIADYNLPQFSAIEALRILQESGQVRRIGDGLKAQAFEFGFAVADDL